MSRPPYPKDVAAELAVIEAIARAKQAERSAWTTAHQLITDRRITIETVARLTGVSTRTAARRLAAVKDQPAQAACRAPEHG